MKILVCISHVPDTTTKIQFNADGQALNRTGVTFVINPYDEYGLSKALNIKEEGSQVSVTALSVGGLEVEASLRKALAIGADDAVRINLSPEDSQQVAEEIANYAEPREFDIIFMGKESIDFNNGLVPGLVAEMLGMPFVSFATKMDLTGENQDQAILHREVDGGYEVMESSLPMVVSCQKGISEWRIPNMRGIMAARKKPLSVVSGTSAESVVATTGFDYPEAKGSTVYIDTEESAKLIDALVEKGII